MQRGHLEEPNAPALLMLLRAMLLTDRAAACFRAATLLTTGLPYPRGMSAPGWFGTEPLTRCCHAHATPPLAVVHNAMRRCARSRVVQDPEPAAMR